MGKFIKNWKTHGRPFSGQRLRKKLEGMAPEYVEAKVAERVGKLDKARDRGLGTVKAIVSGVPFVGSAAKAIAATPLGKVKAVQGLANIASKVTTATTGGGSILADILPAYNDFKRGDIKGGILALLAFVITSGAGVWIAAKYGVTLPVWLLPTLLDLLQQQGAEAAALVFDFLDLRGALT